MTSFFDSAYAGIPPWDIGHPQPEFVRLAEVGDIRGDVLDVGCGTGENAIFLAGLGHDVWGVDASATAIEKARAKAVDRGAEVTFLVYDVLDLENLGKKFDVAIDSGLFHIFSDEERPQFSSSLAAALRPGGTYHMLCFSEHEPDCWGGPRRVTQREIEATFREGWKIHYIGEAKFQTNIHPAGGRAWLSSIMRL